MWEPALLDPGLPNKAPLDRLACLDIETTGLSLGAGNVAFLVGTISAAHDSVVLKQFLIRDFTEEAAQHELLARHLDDMEILVTYNGARFDLPILRSRGIIHRVDAPWLSKPHLDLLYPVRSVWRRTWPDCRLATAEMRLLGVVRHNDCESWEVPLRFRQFLALPAEETLHDVLEHNAQDLVSLFCLLAVLQRTFSLEFTGFGLAQSELLGLARSQAWRGRWEVGRKLYELASQMGRLAPDYDRHMRHYVRLLKKHAQWGAARSVWQDLAGAPEAGLRFWALVEEAKFFEHREKSPEHALLATERAFRELDSVSDLHTRERLHAELASRRQRLLRLQKAG
jgi:hypothetical protein